MTTKSWDTMEGAEAPGRRERELEDALERFTKLPMPPYSACYAPGCGCKSCRFVAAVHHARAILLPGGQR